MWFNHRSKKRMAIRNFIFGVFVVSLLTVMFVLTGCDDADTQRNTYKEVPVVLPSQFTNLAGQDVFYVQIGVFKNWLESNKEREIVSITSFAVQRSLNSNPTDGFVIVCKNMPSEATKLLEVRRKIQELQIEEKQLREKP